MAARNAVWILLTILLYVITCWIPYINIGTTIALSNLPSALASGKSLSPTYIFDAKYRKYMGEYMILLGTRISNTFASIPFFFIPCIILSYGWRFVRLLLIDKEINVSEAFTQSTKLTYGYKMTMFMTSLVINIVYIFASVILCWILNSIFGWGFTILIIVLLVLFYLMLQPSITAVFYKHLVINRNIK